VYTPTLTPADPEDHHMAPPGASRWSRHYEPCASERAGHGCPRPGPDNRFGCGVRGGRLSFMASITWGREIAEVYDRVHAGQSEPSVLEPMVGRLLELAQGGSVLEFAIGTGRVALELQARGLSVEGIELSPHMVEQLRGKPGGADVPVTIGDMTGTRLAGSFQLVYLVANTIMNVTTQDQQIAVFVNAADHLQPGGCFVVEVIVPQLRRVPPGETARVFALEPDHVGIETFDDVVGQVAWSHHWMDVDGRLVRHSAPYRYVWPAELDLMGRIAGLSRHARWSGWAGEPFTPESGSQVAVYQKP
jgi:SAM-dependent methyltransferase